MKIWTEHDLAQLDKRCDGITDETAKALAKQPKVNVTIVSGEPYWEGMINGHGLMIRTNESVSVPRDVAVLIESNARVIRESEKRLEQFRKSSGKKLAEM